MYPIICLHNVSFHNMPIQNHYSRVLHPFPFEASLQKMASIFSTVDQLLFKRLFLDKPGHFTNLDLLDVFFVLMQCKFHLINLKKKGKFVKSNLYDPLLLRMLILVV